MKKRIFAVSILVIVFAMFGLYGAFAEKTDTNQVIPQIGVPPVVDANQPVTQQAAETDANTPDANAGDANDITNVGIDELKKELEKVDEDSRREMRVWVRSDVTETKDRETLIKVAQMQSFAELDIIRKFALKEGAVNTVEAIDTLKSLRKERFRELKKELEDESKKLRKEERERRNSTDRKTRRTRTEEQ